MTDDTGSQILIPEAFRALYTDRRGRLTVSREALAARAELCEDLAQQLQETARQLHYDRGVAEDAVLERLHATLAHPDAGLPAAELPWLIGRIAELLDWPPGRWAQVAELATIRPAD
jgi:hypothetical protein